LLFDASRQFARRGISVAFMALNRHDNVAHDVKRVLANIDADDGDRGTQLLGHGVLPSFGARGQHDLAGGAGARPDHPISSQSEERTTPDKRIIEVP
jgi:hypothetical protein